MKHPFRCLFLLLPLACTAYSQEAPLPPEWHVYASVGYTHADFGEIRDYYSWVLASSRTSVTGNSMRADLGNTLLLDAGVLVSRIKLLQMGFSIGYSHSPASAHYEDNAGTFGMDGSVATLQLAFLFQVNPFSFDPVFVFVRAKPFAYHTSAEFTSQLRFWQPRGPALSESELMLSAWSFGAQATIGATLPVGILELSLESGYRFARSSRYDGEIRSSAVYPNVVPYPGTLSWTVDQSGFVFLFSVGMRL